MSEFSDRPFMAGSLVGLRAFSVDSLGRLTGPSHGGVFRPGENVGKCKGGSHGAMSNVPDGVRVTRMFSPMSNWGGPTVYTVEFPDGTERQMSPAEFRAAYPPEEHAAGIAGCSCGFYAYFDGKNDYYEGGRGTVAAVVEGYGVCTVGARGFRSEKMRLVALLDPNPKASFTWWDRHGGKVLLPAAFFNGAVLAARLVHPSWWALLNGVAILLLLWSAYMRGTAVRKKRLLMKDRMDNFELVRRNYPDVPAYASLKGALKAHPLTPPEPISPETDEDFWTRSAS